MIDLEVDPVWEARVRRTFSAIAAVTPVGDVSWTANVRVERLSPTRLLAVAASVVLLTAGAVGVWKVSSRSGSTEPANTLPRPPLVVPPPMIVPPTPVLPEGTEYPIRRVPAFELGSTSNGGPVIDGSMIGYSQTADATQYSYRTLDVQGDYVVERSCVSALVPDVSTPADVITATGCANTLESSLRPYTGAFSQQEDGHPANGFWRWSNVPADTDFVQYRSGELLVWQRPIDGHVHFPAGTAESPEAVAYRADGAVLATVDAVAVAAAEEGAAEFFADLHRESRLDLADVELARDGVQDRFAQCLTSRNVDLKSSGKYERVAFPRDGNIEPAWQACLADAQQWLDAYIDAHS